MTTQMDQPPFLFQDKEWYYQIVLKSGIPQFITSHSLAASLFDVSPLVLSVLFLFTLNRVYSILYTLVVVLYFTTYNLATGHHYHGLIGLMIISIPFWFKKEQRFNLAWEGARYYFLYIFASAALWKILRGSVFYQEQLSNILKSQQINLLLQNPGNYKAHIAQYLISHPGVSHAILIVDVLVQLSFVVGFFTRKYDKVLFVLAIVFCVANFYVMSIISAELLILNLTLLNWEWVKTFLTKKGVLTA